MPRFSKRSKSRLKTCDNELQTLFNEVVVRYDCTILCGHRGKTAQNKAFNDGFSKLKYPNSNHNKIPSMAVDVAPYVGKARGNIDWKDINQFYHFAGYVRGVAERLLNEGVLTYSLRWGGDWKRTYTQTKKNKFRDLVHFELDKKVRK